MSEQSYAERRETKGVAKPRKRALLDAAMVVAASGVAQLVAVIQGVPLSTGWLLTFAALAIALLTVAPTPAPASVPAQVYGALTATALAALAVLILRLQAGFDAAAAGETVRQWAFVAVYVVTARTAISWRASAAQAVAPTDAVAESVDFSLLAARELARARRHALPLTLLVLDPRRSALERGQRAHDLKELRQILARELRLIDAFGVLEGRVIVILPDTEAPAALLARVCSALSPELAARLELGQASFPDEETTFVGLHERALERRAHHVVAAPHAREATA